MPHSGIRRSAIREDLLQFGLPAFLVLVVGLVVCSSDGYDGMTATLFRVLTHPQEPRGLPASKALGLAILVIGFTICFTAVFTLKGSYSSTLVTRVDHRLVTHGIYRHLRHPVYLGVLLILVIALPVYSTSRWGFVVLSLLVPLFVRRIRIEERLLTEEFGELYRDYRTRTRALVPFAW